MTNRDGIEALIRDHIERRPFIKATDVYKLLYQGVFGVGHIIGDGAWHRLEVEAANLDLDENLEEPLIESVSADGSTVRVNLRPYLRRGLPLNRLFSAMKATAEVEGSPEEFLEAWGVFKGLVTSGELPVDLGELEELDEELRREGCRPRHHSEAYRIAYHPAYRVIRRDVLDGEINPTFNK